MSNEVRIHASVNDDVSGPLSKIRDKFEQMGKAGAASSIAIGAGSAVASAGLQAIGSAAYAAGAFIGGSVAKASDLNETLSKSSVIFGDSAGKMEKFGNTAATSLGLSKQAAIEAGASMGNFFTGIGQSQPVAEKMSENMVTLAGDLASFNNLDPTDVLDKLRSGLTGEAEPLRSVGVFLTEAKVKAKAMQLGLADAHGELSEGAKVLARYQVILDETKTAQGDFARTADGLANSQRTVNAELEDVQAKLGQKLLPAWTEANKVVLRFLDSTTIGFKDMQAAAAAGSQDAQRHLQQLARVADEAGVTTEQAWLLIQGGATATADGIRAAAHEAAGSFETLAGKAQDDLAGSSHSVASAAIDMRDAVVKSMAASAKAAEDNEQRTTAAMKGVIDNAYEPLIAEAEIAATKRDIAEQDQIISSKDSTAAQIADAQLRKLELQKQLDGQIVDQQTYASESERIAYLTGQLQNQNLIDGLHSKDPQVRAQAQATVAAIEAELQGLQSRANGYGFATGGAWASGIVSGMSDAYDEVTGAFKQYEGLFYASSPPGPKSPLHHIDKWGKRTGQAWAKGLAEGIGGDSSNAALGALASGLSPAGVVGNSAFGLAGGNGRNSAGFTINGGVHLHGVGSDVSGRAAQAFADDFLHRIGNGLREEGARFTARQRVGARV